MTGSQHRKWVGRWTCRQDSGRSDHFRDECGLFGFFDPAARRLDAAKQTYLGLFALQHRGQDSAGIAINNQGSIQCSRNPGLVVEAFTDEVLDQMPGYAAIGHVRYADHGMTAAENAQPMLIKYRSGQIALAINGCLNNHDELRRRLQDAGAIFQTGSAAETLLALLARSRMVSERIEEALEKVAAELSGAYALILMTPGKIVGMRDPLGVRPLCLGRLDDVWLLASESCAIEAIGGHFVRDVCPGEIITLSAAGVQSNRPAEDKNASADRCSERLCLFEYVYFARPDSVLDTVSVQESRYQAGRRLAAEQPVQADLIIGVPDSGLTAALGYAQAGGIPYGQGILKNRYVGRSFILPTPTRREMSVTMKFSALRHAVAGKNIALIDDSLIRGTTIRHLVFLLKQAGAKSVHLRIASPPVLYPCFYGVDTPSQAELPACRMNRRELCGWIGADSLAYLSLDGLRTVTGTSGMGRCSSCFDGTFPAGLPTGQKNRIKVISWLENKPAETDLSSREDAHA
ncbi:MAG: amidophosphoribosyltransferase [Clostridiaceae bacterium]|nr:amidophosphoribosyltransferase [Clostridiaceae bacterium]